MILVDTSVWVDHLRKTNKKLVTLLLNEQVVMHPLVIGELSCGNLAKRAEILGYFHNLPKIDEIDHSEVLNFIETHRLFGKGVGYADIHLLVSALISRCKVWSLDKRLADVATKMGVAG